MELKQVLLQAWCFLLLLHFWYMQESIYDRAVSTEQRERARQMMIERNRKRKVKQNLMEL